MENAWESGRYNYIDNTVEKQNFEKYNWETAADEVEEFIYSKLSKSFNTPRFAL